MLSSTSESLKVLRLKNLYQDQEDAATSKTKIYFQHINFFMMFLTIIITMVLISIIPAVMIITTKYSLPTIDFATRYSTRYSDFLLQPYSK